MYIGGTTDEEIYRYGVHAPEFWVNLTVAPGNYTVRLHWADTPETPWVEREGDKLGNGFASHHGAHQWRNGG